MPLFPGDLIRVAKEIRELYPTVSYDHRPFLTEREPDYTWKQEEKFRVGYACLKWAVAKVLQPKTIREIGVGGGVAAMAFLDACPEATYVGVDSGRLGVERGFDFSADVLAKIHKHHPQANALIERIDSRQLAMYPKVDLIHVDGGHAHDIAYHDVRLALGSGSEWTLVDDARDNVVCSAAFRAFWDYRGGPTEWAYFEDSWTGSILFWQGVAR